MPPKKKKGKKKGKKGEPGELTVKDKYNKTLQEVDSLKHELETRSELARRNNAKANDLKLKVSEWENVVKEEQEEKLDISADMVRQYKTMQSTMALRIHLLETSLAHMQVQLDTTKSKLDETEKAKSDLQKKYDDAVEKMEREMSDMEKKYESILIEAMDAVAGKLEQAQSRWQKSCEMVQLRNIGKLREFGLPNLEL
ncbi:coiled-coil domain-containing protein 153-like [Bolinopsis microptera]|uniref:coiled-coil domain-containing protein 153-like n=1 Tax=Bolinopsis microptera TaxID=2820187 RepID=UPI003079619C